MSGSAVPESVSELRFGTDFDGISSTFGMITRRALSHKPSVLSNAQVAVILQASADSATTRDEELNAVYQKTQKYVNRFNSMNNEEKERQEIVDELDNLQEYVGWMKQEAITHTDWFTAHYRRFEKIETTMVRNWCCIMPKYRH